MRSRLLTHVFLLWASLWVSCAHRPIDELALADAALKAALKVKADAMAPDMYRKAENYYLRAKRDYSDGYYDAARKYADQARLFAEQAEYRALFKQTQLKSRPIDDPAVTPETGAPPPPEPIE